MGQKKKYKKLKEDALYTTKKIMLCPTASQLMRLYDNISAARFASNWVYEYEETYHKENNKYLLNDCDLRKIFTREKHTNPDLAWTNDISNDIFKQAIKDKVDAYISYIKKATKQPTYDRKRFNSGSFYIDSVKLKITSNRVKLEKISKNRAENWIDLAEQDKIPLNAKYYNPRVVFDGIHYWLCVTIETSSQNLNTPITDGIGCDLGLKETIVTSDGYFYHNINKTSQHLRKLEKRKKRLQRKKSHAYECGKTPDGKFHKTNNIERLNHKIAKTMIDLTNIRKNYNHTITREIINRNPSFIVLEDLKVKNLMKNKHLSRAISEQNWSALRFMIEYKAQLANIPVIIAGQYYASSQICSECGHRFIGADKLKLSDRQYICPDCGCVLDRDLNAAINLKHYGEKQLKIK